MADVCLFGASGYTGRLVAHALAERGIPFLAVGRDPVRLHAVAAAAGAEDVRTADAGDPPSIAHAARGTRVLLSTVGPFLRLGVGALEAAVRAGVHYLDCCGEGPFVSRVLQEHDAAARSAGVAMVTAMGFEEVPADVAAALACEGLGGAALVLSYAVPSGASAGTLRSAIGALLHEAGPRETEPRWAPMPPPLGPRPSVRLPLAEAAVAPSHLEVSSVETYVTVGLVWKTVLTRARAILRLAAIPPGAAALDRLTKLASGPTQARRARARWTILAEATSPTGWRNVALAGVDPYGLTAHALAEGARMLADPGYARSGAMGPVAAFGVDALRGVLAQRDVETTIWAPRAQTQQDRSVAGAHGG